MVVITCEAIPVVPAASADAAALPPESAPSARVRSGAEGPGAVPKTLEDVDALCYLVHSLDRRAFEDRDRVGAETIDYTQVDGMGGVLEALKEMAVRLTLVEGKGSWG